MSRIALTATPPQRCQFSPRSGLPSKSPRPRQTDRRLSKCRAQSRPSSSTRRRLGSRWAAAIAGAVSVRFRKPLSVTGGAGARRKISYIIIVWGAAQHPGQSDFPTTVPTAPIDILSASNPTSVQIDPEPPRSQLYWKTSFVRSRPSNVGARP